MSTGIGMTELIKWGSYIIIAVIGIVTALRAKDKSTKVRKALLIIPGLYFANVVLGIMEMAYRYDLSIVLRRYYNIGELLLMIGSIVCLLVLFYMKGSAAPNAKHEAVNRPEKEAASTIQYTYEAQKTPDPVVTPVQQQSYAGAGTAENFSYTRKSVESDVGQALMAVVKPAVCSQLKSPASAKFPTDLITIVGDDARGYQVSGFVDSQNSYGAMIRNDFTANVVMVNGCLVVRSVSVAAKANVQRAKQFGINYIAISIFTLIGGAAIYFIIYHFVMAQF